MGRRKMAFLTILVYVATLSAGFVASNLVRVGYVTFSGRQLGYAQLVTPGFFQPLRALVVVAAGPVLVLRWGLSLWGSRRRWASFIIGYSFLWSFMEGVVIVTQCFGLT
jgi:hypothetical protein